jgi:hypothetical protein
MTGARAPSRGPSAPPPRWRKWAIRGGIALLLLAVAAWGGFTWLFYNPLEGDLERLDRVIPSSVGLAFRGSAEELLASPFLRTRVLARTDVEDALSRWGLEDALRRLEEEEGRLDAGLPFFLSGFRFRRDLLGRETAVFGTLEPAGEGPPAVRAAVATRLSGKARMMLSVLKHGWARDRVRERSGIGITRYPLIYEVDASSRATDPRWATLWASLVRDVLIVGNDRDLVTASAHLASSGGSGSLPDRPDAGAAFSGEGTAPLRAWVDAAKASRDAREAGRPTLGQEAGSLEGIPGLLGLLIDPDALSTAAAVARFPSGDEAVLEVHGVRGGDALPALPAALAGRGTRGGAEALREAALLSPAGSAFAAARLEAPASALLPPLLAGTGADVRAELDKWLRERKTSLEDLGREMDDYLEPGVSVVLERLPECSSLSLDQYGAGASGAFVLPLPGVLLVARQRASAGEGAAERWVRKWLEAWKEQLSVREDVADLPGGVKGIRFRPKFLTGEKDLVRPAIAFDGDMVLLASNEGTLRRALETRSGSAADGEKRPALSDFDGFEAAAAACGEGQGLAVLEGGALRSYLGDQRREAATRMVEKDWTAERRRIMAEVARVFFEQKKVIAQKEIVEEVDRQVDQAISFQREVEFPRALEDYVRRLEPLEEVRFLAAGLSWDTDGLSLLLSVRARER